MLLKRLGGSLPSNGPKAKLAAGDSSLKGLARSLRLGLGILGLCFTCLAMIHPGPDLDQIQQPVDRLASRPS